MRGCEAQAARLREMEARARELEEECEERVAEVEGELVKCKMEAAERMTSASLKSASQG